MKSKLKEIFNLDLFVFFMETQHEDSENKPLTLVIPSEFYEDLDRRIRKAVTEAIEVSINEISKTTKYLTRKQVCQLLNISLPTLMSYCNKGILKGKKIGNRILFVEEMIKDSLSDLPTKFRRR